MRGANKIFEFSSVKLYQADFLEIELKPNSVDLVITSPPYNLDIHYGIYDDNLPYDKYLEFSKLWLEKTYKLLKDDGRLCLNIPLDKNKGKHQCTFADIVHIAQEIGYKYHATIIWHKGHISKRTAWGSWLSASAPCVIAPVEVIAVLYKKQWKKKRDSKLSDISKDEFINWTNGLWFFPGENQIQSHPAPFPLELPKRCIKLFSFIDDVILDPFVGSGTTLVACLQLQRKGIGVEIDEKYFEVAKKRIMNEGNKLW